MTRKQFLGQLTGLERNDKNCCIDLVKSYRGKLSYAHLYLIIRSVMSTYGQIPIANALWFAKVIMSDRTPIYGGTSDESNV